MAVDSKPAPVELWRHPDPESTQMYKFLQKVKAKYDLDIHDYPGLYQWSIENVAEFWEEVWHFCGIKASKPYSQVGRPQVICCSLARPNGGGSVGKLVIQLMMNREASTGLFGEPTGEYHSRSSPEADQFVGAAS